MIKRFTLFVCIIATIYYTGTSSSIYQSTKSLSNSNLHTNHNIHKQHKRNNKILSKNTNIHVVSSQHKEHEKLNILSLVTNIVADLCPHGMMPLAYGLSQGASGPTGCIPALVLMILFGSMSAYTMISYADISKQTNSKNIGELWSKLINPKTKWLIDLSVFLLCFGCCVFYSAFVGDIFTSLSSVLGLKGLLNKRWFVLLSISSSILLPLCQLEDLSALKFSSILGVGGIFYTVFFHILRYIDGSYSSTSLDKSNNVITMLPYVAMKMQPKFPTPKMTLMNTHSGTLVLMNMLCVAFLSHYNSINYYEEFDQPINNRFSIAVGIGFTISMLVFTSMMFLGYFLFGTSVQPLLLNNFPNTKDTLASLARVATGLAITFAYPLMFAGLKTSMFSLLTTYLSNNNKNNKNINNNNNLLDTHTYETVLMNNILSKSMKSISIAMVLGIYIYCFRYIIYYMYNIIYIWC